MSEEKKTIAITGATGFIGTALSHAAVQAFSKVILASRADMSGTLSLSAEPMMGSLHSPDFVDELVARSDTIYHLSAISDLKITEADELRCSTENINPLVNLINSAEKLGRSDLQIIFLSTSTVVGLGAELPSNETAVCRPITNYDRCKLIGEEILATATKQHIVRGCSIRLCNVFGHVHSQASKNINRGFINAMTKRALEGGDLPYYSGSTNLRDFIHITDVISALIKVEGVPAAFDGSALLLGCGNGLSVKHALEVIATQANTYGLFPRVIETEPPRDLHPIETRDFFADCSKIKNLTGWSCKHNFSNAIWEDLAFLAGTKDVVPPR